MSRRHGCLGRSAAGRIRRGQNVAFLFTSVASQTLAATGPLQGAADSADDPSDMANQSPGYRVGCLFTEIAGEHRAKLARHAAQNAADRRAGGRPSTLRERLFLPD